MKNFFLLSIAALLSGCAAVYVPPKEIDSPTVKIDTSQIDLFTMYENGANCAGLRKIPPEYNPFRPGSVPIPLAADKEVAFRLYSGSGYPTVTYCALMLSFTPTKNTDYLLRYEKREKKCYAILFKRARRGGGDYTVDDSLRKRKEKPAITNEDPFCEAGG